MMEKSAVRRHTFEQAEERLAQLSHPVEFNQDTYQITESRVAGQEKFFALRHQTPASFERVWIFDADDTLWEDNRLYLQIGDELAEHIRQYLGDMTRQEVLERIDRAEAEIFPVHGAGAYSFERAIVAVIDNVRSEYGIDIPYSPIVDKVVPYVTGGPYKLEGSVVETLEYLKGRGDGLVIHTEGFLDLQLGKLSRSGLLDHFHAVSIVRKKSVTALVEMLEGFSRRSEFLAVVGNSLNSDIVPALGAKLAAFHYLNPHTWTLVNNAKLAAGSYREIRSIAELQDL